MDFAFEVIWSKLTSAAMRWFESVKRIARFSQTRARRTDGLASIQVRSICTKKNTVEIWLSTDRQAKTSMSPSIDIDVVRIGIGIGVGIDIGIGIGIDIGIGIGIGIGISIGGGIGIGIWQPNHKRTLEASPTHRRQIQRQPAT